MPLSRESLLDHLQMTERHIVEGKANLARMEQRVTELSRGGYDTRSTEELLATLRETQTLHEADRVLVLMQIEDLDRGKMS